MARKLKLGTGKRFKKLSTKLGRKRGKSRIRDPKALAADIGRKKFGKGKFQKLAAKGKRRAAKKRKTKSS
ncbi:MAG: hypothetical protein ACXACR_14935 [Candidatus Hodarchaeales archaeon]